MTFTIRDIRDAAEDVGAHAMTVTSPDAVYGPQGVRWLDGFIERQRERGIEDLTAGLVMPLGSFLGECVIRTFGGEWIFTGEQWCVCFDNSNAVFPFAKVERQLRTGASESVLSFFLMIECLHQSAVNR